MAKSPLSLRLQTGQDSYGTCHYTFYHLDAVVYSNAEYGTSKTLDKRVPVVKDNLPFFNPFYFL